MSKLKAQMKRGILFIFCLAIILFAFQVQRDIPVLMYHFVGSEREASEDSLVVSERTFESHLELFKKWGYETLSLDEYAARRSGIKSFGFRKAVLITFDDGNFSFHDRVFPLLEKYQMKAANFLVFKSLLNRTEGSMSVDQAKRLSASPLVSFGSHTATHKILKDLSESGYQQEIVDSKMKLEEVLGIPIRYFCYPGGHFDDRALEMVKKAGYQLAFTTSFKRLKGKSLNNLSIPRIKITEKDRNPLLFWAKTSGLYSTAQTLRFRIQNAFNSK